MSYNRVISTAVLFLLLGTTLPAFAQKGGEAKGGGKSQQAQHQSQPQHQQQAQHQSQPQHAQQAQRQSQHQAQPQRSQHQQQQHSAVYSSRNNGNHGNGNNGYHGNGNNGNHYGRISNANYNAHFGEGHSFRMGRPQMIGGYNRFQYGGYWFGYNQQWPMGWNYDDDCYVVFVDGYYYMYNRRHPGIHIALNIF